MRRYFARRLGVLVVTVIEGVLLITIANFLADAVQQMLDPKVRQQA